MPDKLFQIKHRFTGKVLFELKCGSMRLAVEAAIEQKANLTRANLTGANLTGANLTWANLTWANLTRANNIILLPVQDPRGYSFAHAINTDNGWRIRAGCRFFTIEDAREHWGPSYQGDREIGDNYLYAVDWLEKKLRGIAGKDT